MLDLSFINVMKQIKSTKNGQSLHSSDTLPKQSLSPNILIISKGTN